MTEHEHLGEKFYVDQAARSLLDIEAMFVLGADFAFHPHSHNVDLVRFARRESAAKDELFARVLDLANNNLPRWLKLEKWMQENFSRINQDRTETICQALGRAARNLGMSAIRYPSARVSGGINLAVFRHRLRKEESMRLLGEVELKKYLV